MNGSGSRLVGPGGHVLLVVTLVLSSCSGTGATDRNAGTAMSYRADDGRHIVETSDGPVTMCAPGQSLDVRHGPSWSSDNPGWGTAIEAAVEVDDRFSDAVHVGSTVQLLSDDGSTIIGLVSVLTTGSGGYLWNSTYQCFAPPSVG